MNAMAALLVGLMLFAPALAVALCALLRGPRLAERVNLVAALVSFACSLAMPWLAGGTPPPWLDGYLRLDGLAAWTLLCTGIVYLLASIYAVGYMRLSSEPAHLHRFYALFAAFALSMFVAPLMNNAGVFWIAVELTTLISTFLVGFEREAESIEAAWKYIVVVSAGISLALLGTVLLYWAGSFVLGPHYDMTWSALAAAAPRMNPVLLQLAFLLMLVGYGTKAGLAPMHTWLPDAHSEGPAPVSAMLSGALLNTAMIGIVRALQLTDTAGLSALPRTVLVAFGAFSLLVAALFIVRQEGIKRLMAYSSVEHIGVLALGFGFGGPLGVAGAMYHMLGHSLNKSLMFFGAGNAMRLWGSKSIADIRGVLQHMRGAGLLWLAGAVAITGAPPFSLLLSEFTILRAGIAGPNAWAVWVMALLLIVIFVGFLNHFRLMYFGDDGASAAPTTAVVLNGWMLWPMALALAPLLLLGLWWPQPLWEFFRTVAASLAAGAT
jgi:hydrogenase-4 component F